MSVFSPAARVTDPDGRDWEIYAYRIQLRRAASSTPPTTAHCVGRGPPIPPFDGILWMFGEFLVTPSASSGTSRAPRSPRAARTSGRSRP